MRTYNYFWDLKGATAYSDCMIRSYANHTTFGGGMFKWVPIVGAVTDIPGIRIQPSANTNGYFERVMGNEVYADWFGPVHANTTFAGAGISLGNYQTLYPGVTVTTGSDPQVSYNRATTDNIDWAALQQAITYACNTNRPLMMGGTDYYVNKGLLINKLATSGATLNIDGGGGEIRTTNTNNFVVLGRPIPTDNTDATDNMTGLKIRVANLRIGMNAASTAPQIGISLGPSYNNEYTNLQLVGLDIGLHLRFALNTSVTNCEANLCKIGFAADNGGTTLTSTNSWPGGSGLATSQSNCTRFQNCRAYMRGDESASYGFAIIDADACCVRDSVVEGTACENGIHFDSLSATVVYNFVVDNVHFEAHPGSTGDGCINAAVYIRAAAGNYQISNIYGQFPGILVDAGEAVTAEMAITVSGVYYWVPSAVDGCALRGRSAGLNWLFLHNNKNFTGNAVALLAKFSTTNGTGGAFGVTHNYQATLTTTDAGGGPWVKFIPTTS